MAKRGPGLSALSWRRRWRFRCWLTLRKRLLAGYGRRVIRISAMSLPYPPRARGPAYLTPCACFNCRKSFKKNLADPRYVPVCPECKKPLTDMGRYFRAPRKADAAQWEKVEMLRRAGVYFARTQSSALGKLPDTVQQAEAFIAKNGLLLQEGQRQRELGKAAILASLQKKEAARQMTRLKIKSKKRSDQIGGIQS